MKRTRDGHTDGSSSPYGSSFEPFPALDMPPSEVPLEKDHDGVAIVAPEGATLLPIVRINPSVRCMIQDRMELRTLSELVQLGEECCGSAQTASSITPLLGPIPFALSPRKIATHNITSPNTLRFSDSRVVDPTPQSLLDARFVFTTLLRSAQQSHNGSMLCLQDTETQQCIVQGLEGVCRCLVDTLQKEVLFVSVKAPCYVVGDIHGNYTDLTYFLNHMIPFGDPLLCTSNLLFLGDYVDRGTNSFACVATLFAMKVLNPAAVHLLRGNHEDPKVCCDISTYGRTSFHAEVVTTFGHTLGTRIFDAVTSVFTHLPLACEIVFPGSERRLLCTHGGIPRFQGSPLVENKLAMLRDPRFPHLPTLFTNTLWEDSHGEDERARLQACWVITLDILWSDPTSDDTHEELDDYGFAHNARGDGVVSFSSRAVNSFLTAHGYDMLLRAHQEKVFGLKLSKSSRVLTIFSSSNYQGSQNSAGCALVAPDGNIHLILRN